MRAFPSILPLLVALSLGTFGCTSSEAAAPSAPDGVVCKSTVPLSGLATAQEGQCVLLAGDTAGPLSVPKGVIVAAQRGATVTIAGNGAEPVVTLAEAAQLVSVRVTGGKGVGVAVRGPSAVVRDVRVDGAASAALAVRCAPACTTETSFVTLRNVTLENSQMGLWASAALVRWTQGASLSHASTGLTAAAGLVALDGARVELDTVRISKNQGLGVLLDGATTSGKFKDVEVSDNNERGLWAQRLQGTLDAPALLIEGKSSFDRNRIVGLGALESRGIIFVGGRIADTQLAPQVTNLGQTEDVGDGVGLFEGTGDIKLDQVELSRNARTAGLIDKGERGIIFVGGKVESSGTGLKIVVQNTSPSVQLDEAQKSVAAKALGVSAPKIGVSPVLGN
jgi:hypothetical protein